MWPADSNFIQVSFVQQGPFTYLFGAPCLARRRRGEARTGAERSLLDPSAYQYWTGKTWSSNIDVGEDDRAVRCAPVLGALQLVLQEVDHDGLTSAACDRRHTDRTVEHAAERRCRFGRTLARVLLDYAPVITPSWNDGPDIWFTIVRSSQLRRVADAHHTHTRRRTVSTPITIGDYLRPGKRDREAHLERSGEEQRVEGHWICRHGLLLHRPRLRGTLLAPARDVQVDQDNGDDHRTDQRDRVHVQDRRHQQDWNRPAVSRIEARDGNLEPPRRAPKRRGPSRILKISTPSGECTRTNPLR